MRSTGPSGDAWLPSPSLGIPDGVREAIERRLATLSPATRRVVTMAAAIGRSFSIEVLDALAELPASVLEALEEAAERRIVERRPVLLGRYTVRPRADSRDALRVAERAPASRAAPPDRRDPRGAARGDAEPPLGELAYHFVAAAEPGAAARPSTTRPGRPAGRWPRWHTRRPSAISTAPSRPWSSRSPRTTATRCELLLGLGGPSRQGQRVRAQPRRLPGRRGARTDAGLGSTSPARRWASAGVDRAGHRGPGDHRAAARGARRAARARARRSGPGCWAASPWSFTSPTSPSAAGRWRGGRGARKELADPVDARVRAQRPPLGAARPGRGRRAARIADEIIRTQRRPPSSSSLSRATAGASSTSSSSDGRRDRRRDRGLA
jgi:hypothetical protein